MPVTEQLANSDEYAGLEAGNPNPELLEELSHYYNLSRWFNHARAQHWKNTKNIGILFVHGSWSFIDIPSTTLHEGRW